MCIRDSINLGKLVTEATVEELTSGQGEYTVKVERAEEALALIQRQPWGREARQNSNGALITMAPEGRGRDLNLFLVNAGFVPDSLTQTTQDLEQVFLHLTNSGSGEIQ